MKKILAAILTLTLALGASFALADEITVVSREEGSGTRGAFVELTGVEAKTEDGKKIDNTTEDAMITNATSVMMVTVAGNADAIGYISLGSLNDTVKALEIDGAAPSVESIKDGSYKIARPFTIVTTEKISAPAQEFLSFILSQEGQQVIQDNGYIAISQDTVPFESQKNEGKVVVAGSSSVTPVMEKLQEAFKAFNPNITIEIQQSDSTTGVNAAIDGVADLGMASRALKDSEIEKGAAGTEIAIDGIVVIVNNDNPVTGMTMANLTAIFTGSETDWENVK